MKIILIVVGVVILAFLVFIIRTLRKASSLDLIHYPKEGIDMCRRCLHEYQSYQIEGDLRTIEQASRMNVNLPEDFWGRFCCDALRNKLKAYFKASSRLAFSELIRRAERKLDDRE